METNLTSYQRKGVDKHNLVAGLCYSIAKNYLTQVVGKKRIGDHIFFQGAVAFNKGVVAAFEQILGKPITVPPHPHVKYRQSIFICDGCPNHCEIKKVVIEGEATPLYYGARCERYEIKKKEQPKHKLPDLFRAHVWVYLMHRSSTNICRFGWHSCRSWGLRWCFRIEPTKRSYMME
ncbi:hypothetical protein CGW93_04890 [candidate division bacterium WOR-3 4484_18]|uniref:Uncharacterized protein n=1 Tax=candidate division WOR-3 bacterium 4484_18 TaxID=2020626 RepID=A0A257LSZ8_UNCW3|nr:MAG: hypothetical protein CGW93_04890 [candidate division bacterium WOR-3 4484_18]